MVSNWTNNGSNDELIGNPSLNIMILHNMIIFIFIIFGNTNLIYVILRSNAVLKRKRLSSVQVIRSILYFVMTHLNILCQFPYALLLHMSAADLLFALLTILPTMLIIITDPIFYGPNIVCKFVKYVQVMPCNILFKTSIFIERNEEKAKQKAQRNWVIPMYASSFLLVAISADRYHAICRPLAAMRNDYYNRPSVYAAIAWSLAGFLSIPQFFNFAKHEDGDCRDTYTSEWQYSLYVVFFNIMVWLLPSSIAGYFYYNVCRSVRVKAQRIELDRRHVQTVKLTLTIVAANFILWAPFCIINPVFATYIMFFGNLNSCMNPWIWFLFNKESVKRAFCSGNKKVLRLTR
ncbi:unnamed protein product [Anisakis simplex]|uniref:NTR-1 (inferred by orthology to a C. elegans protein) n=1 Tax=Anisakis simplex TaxID=6269 RepID=A0A158PP75_ANISI|nr:unnamed protein product [Anisakis simplex]